MKKICIAYDLINIISWVGMLLLTIIGFVIMALVRLNPLGSYASYSITGVLVEMFLLILSACIILGLFLPAPIMSIATLIITLNKKKEFSKKATLVMILDIVKAILQVLNVSFAFLGFMYVLNILDQMARCIPATPFLVHLPTMLGGAMKSFAGIITIGTAFMLPTCTNTFNILMVIAIIVARIITGVKREKI